MRRITLRLIIATLTFGLGVALTCWWFTLFRARDPGLNNPQSARVAPPVTAGAASERVGLRVHSYNNDEALLALENNTGAIIHVAYEPTQRRRPARLVYRLERRSPETGKAAPLSTESFDAFPGWNPLAPQTTVIFRAQLPQNEAGAFRIAVGYLMDAETAEIANSALDDPRTFAQKIARRDREMKEAHSDWFPLPAKGDEGPSRLTTRPAVTEPPAPGGRDVIESEDAVINLLQTGFGSGQINCFYDRGRRHQRYCSFEELVSAGWVKASDTEYAGYRIIFTLSADKQHYETIAVPIRYGETGVFSFYADEDGPVRAADKRGQPATANDPSIFDQRRWANR